MKQIAVGLIKGRHSMPVENYIFDHIEDVHEYSAMESAIVNWLDTHMTLGYVYGQGINQCGYEDVQIMASEEELCVYVTGLTPVVASLIKVCALRGISLTLMNYDTSTGAYVEQNIFQKRPVDRCLFYWEVFTMEKVNKKISEYFMYSLLGAVPMVLLFYCVILGY